MKTENLCYFVLLLSFAPCPRQNSITVCIFSRRLNYDHAKEALEPYNTKTKPYTRMVDTDAGEVNIHMAYNYKPRKMAFWNRLMIERETLLEECAVSGFTYRQTNLSIIVMLICFNLLQAIT